MSTSRRRLTGRGVLLAALVYFGLPSLVSAQEAGPAADVAAAPAVAADPTVRAVLELPRETPGDHFRAVVTLMDLAATQQAAQLLRELAARELTEDEQAELVSEFGTYRMMQLVRDDALAEIAAPFVDACMAAAAAAARDPERIEQLLQQLSDDSPAARHAAIVDLTEAGRDGVRAIVESLAREDDTQQRAALRRALVETSPLSIGPTLALLSTNNPQLEADAIAVLAELGISRSIPLLAVAALLSPADSAPGTAARQAYFRLTGNHISLAEAQERLSREVERYVKGMLPETPDADGKIELWFWNDSEGRLISQRFPSGEASVVWAARLAEDLYRLTPTDRANQQLAVLLGIETAKMRQGYELKLAELALPRWLRNVLEAHVAEPAKANDLLAKALAIDCAGAAVAVCEMLAAAGDVDVLYSYAPQRPPLSEALRHADRRVRFAAIQAIMALDPQVPYAGSSRVPELLQYFATGGVAPDALLGGPLAEKVATTAGLLETAGYSTEVALTGNDLVRLARGQADAQLVVVDVRIQSPGIRDVVVTLRSHPESAALPIAVLAPVGYQSTAYRLAEEVAGVVAIAPPHTSEAAEELAERTLAVWGRGFVPLAERAEQASVALDHLTALLAQKQTFYDLRGADALLSQSLHRPALGERAIEALASVGTPVAQLRLVDYASRPAVPLELRRAAADAFAQSVELHGVLLTTDQIQHQYDLYNASESEDLQSQQVLGHLLDSLESRRDQGI